MAATGVLPTAEVVAAAGCSVVGVAGVATAASDAGLAK
jgi:hypothetical protein